MTGKFYTPKVVADLLVSRIPAVNPYRIADICAGSGNLLWAAQKKWPKAFIYAVDEDPSTGKYFKRRNRVRFLLGDGRSVVFERRLHGQCDIVLANPPFAKARGLLPPKFDELVQKSAEIHDRVTKRLEASMLISNLQALARDAFLGIIIPNGLLNAVGWKPLREFLLRGYQVLEIISLPRVFQNVDVNSSILVIRNRIPRKNSKVLISAACVENGKLSLRAGKKVSLDTLTERMDPKYFHVNCDYELCGQYCLNRLPITLRRGCYSVANAKSRGSIRILHSSNVEANGRICGEEHFLRKTELTKGIVCKAKPGDILFVRVGKTLGRTSIVGEKHRGNLISDCLFRIRLLGQQSSRILFDYLLSEHAINYMRSRARGTAANYVTIGDLLSLPVPDSVLEHYLGGKLDR